MISYENVRPNCTNTTQQMIMDKFFYLRYILSICHFQNVIYSDLRNTAFLVISSKKLLKYSNIFRLEIGIVLL